MEWNNKFEVLVFLCLLHWFVAPARYFIFQHQNYYYFLLWPFLANIVWLTWPPMLLNGFNIEFCPTPSHCSINWVGNGKICFLNQSKFWLKKPYWNMEKHWSKNLKSGSKLAWEHGQVQEYLSGAIADWLTVC